MPKRPSEPSSETSNKRLSRNLSGTPFDRKKDSNESTALSSNSSAQLPRTVSQIPSPGRFKKLAKATSSLGFAAKTIFNRTSKVGMFSVDDFENELYNFSKSRFLVSEPLSGGDKNLKKIQFYFQVAVKKVAIMLSEATNNDARIEAGKISADLIDYLQEKIPQDKKNNLDYKALKVYAAKLDDTVNKLSNRYASVQNAEVDDHGYYKIIPNSIITIGNTTTGDTEKYTITEVLSNSNAEIFKCTDKDGKTLVLKFMKEQHFSQNTSEAIFALDSVRENTTSEIFGRADSGQPVIKFIDCGYTIQSGMIHSFTILEECRESLKDKINKNNKTPEARKNLLKGEISVAMLESVKYMHNADYYHQDIKPDNMMFDKDGKLKLIDLGSADNILGAKQKEYAAELRKFGVDPTPPSATTDGYFCGLDSSTRKGPKQYDKSTDIYALGCILFEMYTGERLKDFLNNIDKKGTNYVSNDDDIQKVKNRLEEARKEMGFSSESDFVDKFFGDKGLAVPKDLPELILQMVHYDKSKRPTINEAIENYKWWQEKQNYAANDNSRISDPSIISSLSTIPSSTPIPPLSASTIGEIDKNIEINQTQIQPTHLYIANLKSAGIKDSDEKVQKAKQTLGELTAPIVKATTSLPISSSANSASITADVEVIQAPVLVDITQHQAKFEDAKLNKIKSALNDKIYKDYQTRQDPNRIPSGNPEEEEKKAQDEYLNPELFSGIGVNFNKPIIEKVGRDNYCVFTILGLAQNGPAQVAGLQEGDQIRVKILETGTRSPHGAEASIAEEVEALENLRKYGVDPDNGIIADTGTRIPSFNKIPTAVLNYERDSANLDKIPTGKLEDFGFSKIRDRDKAAEIGTHARRASRDSNSSVIMDL